MYYFIINPKSRSGRGQQIWNAVKEQLDQMELTYECHFTDHKFHATEIVTHLCETKEDKLCNM